ncbi:MAG TPA: DegQ family serine endoprotease [Azospirillum sp.]|nr:DegQ family serine endoprotease [Azospirillum sp.]
MNTVLPPERGAPKRRLRNAVAAVLLGTTVLAGTAAVTVPPPALAATAEARALPDSFAPLVERVSPAVVTISSTHAPAARAERNGPRLPQFPPGSPFEEFFRRFGNPFDGQGQPGPDARGGVSVGSGFVIDAAGYVVTNNHVIDGGKEITVTLSDGTKLPASVVGRDDKTDLALLKVKSDKPMPYLEFGDSDKARVGDWVVAVGNPFGLGGTVTTGVVSARGRSIGAGPYDDFIQTDAPINRGNSGGPMFNLDGEVIGINTAIYSPNGGSVGIGFAAPSNIAKRVVAELKERGHVDRGWLGVRIQPVSPEIAEGLGLDKARGALVADVTKGSPAAKAGLRQGDVILSYGGKPIDDLRALTRAVADTPTGTDTTLEVMRQGKSTTITARIEKQKDEPQQVASAEEPAEHPSIKGVALAPLNADMREQLGLDEGVKGVVVTGVSPKAGPVPLQAGDVIEKVGEHAVKSPAEVARTIAEAEKAGRKAVLLLINRRGDESFVALKLGQA